MEPKTASKMFCGCANDSAETRPNYNVCPICLGHPGTMPFPNIEAIKAIIRLGLALKGEIPSKSNFDRKSYFYPDLPKGYQISQYDHPFVIGGELAGVKITRIHLEEDAGKLIHDAKGETLVDYNRAGVPLIELVTEPDITSAEQASEFTRELQLVLRYLGITNADMEKGEMRLEANISVRPEGAEKLGTKTEVKNLNSFRFMREAIDYEIKRQIEVIENGGKITQETRGWDNVKGETYSQRSKEEAHDYRYLPEPDMPPIDIDKSEEINMEELKASIPEMPANKRRRFAEEYSISEKNAMELSENKELASYFESTVSELAEETNDDWNELKRAEATKITANYILSDLRGMMNETGKTLFEIKISPENMADLAVLIAKGELSSRMAKDILKEMSETGLDPRDIMEKKGMKQVSDDSVIRSAIGEVMIAFPDAVADYKKGKQNALQYLFGQSMIRLKGQGNPEAIKKILQEELDK